MPTGMFSSARLVGAKPMSASPGRVSPAGFGARRAAYFSTAYELTWKSSTAFSQAFL